MLKKLLTFTLILVGAFTLVGCGGTDEPTTAEILEQITEAVDNLSIPSSTETDLVLPTTEVHDVTITWESSDTDYIADDGTPGNSPRPYNDHSPEKYGEIKRKLFLLIKD